MQRMKLRGLRRANSRAIIATHHVEERNVIEQLKLAVRGSSTTETREKRVASSLPSSESISPRSLALRAEKRCDIGSIFTYLSKVVLPTKAIDRYKVTGSLKGLLNNRDKVKSDESQVEDFLIEMKKGLALLHKLQHHRCNDRSWAAIFHDYMLSYYDPLAVASSSSAWSSSYSTSSQSSQSSSSTTTTTTTAAADVPEHLDIFADAALLAHCEDAFRTVTSLGNLEAISRSYLALPEQFLRLSVSIANFLRTHRADPYGFTLGLQATPEFLLQVRQDRTTDEGLEEMVANASKSYDRLELLKHIFTWAEEEQPEKLQKHVREFAAVLRGVTAMPMGAMVLVVQDNNHDSAIFGRFTGAQHGSMVSIYVNAEETESSASIAVPISKVYPLSSRLTTKIESKSITELEQFIFSPVDRLYHSLISQVKAHTLAQLIPTGFDSALFSRCKRDEHTFKDMTRVTKARDLLVRFVDEIAQEKPEQFELPELEARLEAQRAEFLAQGESLSMFLPSKRRVLNQVTQINIRDIIQMTANSVHAITSACVQRLEESKQKWINGTKKDELVSWWLDVIDQKV
jgi:hypothetical protein